jgi:hypothetical protein
MVRKGGSALYTEVPQSSRSPSLLPPLRCPREHCSHPVESMWLRHWRLLERCPWGAPHAEGQCPCRVQLVWRDSLWGKGGRGCNCQYGGGVSIDRPLCSAEAKPAPSVALSRYQAASRAPDLASSYPALDPPRVREACTLRRGTCLSHTLSVYCRRSIVD